MTLPAYNTSRFDSLENIEALFTELKIHFDLNMVYTTAGQFPWDTTTIEYYTEPDKVDLVKEIEYKLGSVYVKKTLTYYSNQNMDERKLFIKGVAQAPLDYAFVMGEKYSYDADDKITGIEKLTS